ncbi:MAG: hypothetical protein GY943_35275 [Chloroflexi bacterium]|nr:hypothetical protein [Chloroflexota bacterium]
MDTDLTGLAFRGSPRYLPSLNQPIQNDAVDHLIARAMVDDKRPLYIAAIGAVTNIASAILIEPKIIERIVVIWIEGGLEVGLCKLCASCQCVGCELT